MLQSAVGLNLTAGGFSPAHARVDELRGPSILESAAGASACNTGLESHALSLPGWQP